MQIVRDTIFALSSGRPPAAIAMVRISGRGAREALDRMCRPAAAAAGCQAGDAA